ncbi:MULTISPECIES: DUF1080 domain-containing protein [unclassified Lentimonas]|uniref:3-keto-disaccharide hydrolase n=1 Tax=unclassified Lentimonas TaxID=2630993 RepID=UPI001326DF41|nr:MULTISPECIES: DUF1080 domain-containing protein [unclassified Lentimonas]CAA6692320.1 Unannotated [Lentimonas sp. CC10]CAA6694654.1 Unannotated [Lentimonas sp. CC19]CAA7071403.1 Unannotated [Lentimonas sp. CC11]
MIRLCLLVLTLSLVQFTDAAPEAEEDLNGFNLSEWALVMADDSVPSDQLMTLEGGGLTLYGNGHPKGIFRTQSAYSNYELSLQWRWPNEPGNGGVMLHCDPAVTRAAWPKCLEVQLKHGRAGNFRKNGETIEVELERTTKKPFIERLILDAEKPAGAWNTMRVIVRRDSVVVYLNDQLVNQGDHASASSGFIALQLELADIQFRRLTLKPLSD